MPLVYDTVVFGFTLAKSIQFWRRDIQSRTINSFFRDGLIYFVGIFIMNLVNVIIFLTQDSTLKGVNLSATLMLNIILACRLVLNLRAPNKSMEYSLPGGGGSAGSSRMPLNVGMGDSPEVTSTIPTSYYGVESVGTKSQDAPAGNVVMISTLNEVHRSPPDRQWDDGVGKHPTFR